MNINWEAWVALLTAIGSMLLAYQLNQSNQEQNFLFKSHEHLVQLSDLKFEKNKRLKERNKRLKEQLENTTDVIKLVSTATSDWGDELEYAKDQILLYEFAIDEKEFAKLKDHIGEIESMYSEFAEALGDEAGREQRCPAIAIEIAHELDLFWYSVDKLITESAEKIADQLRSRGAIHAVSPEA